MSAREDLVSRLVEGGLTEHWAKGQVDAFAHELAEKARQLEPDWDGDEEPWEAWNAAADLIDPEVS